MSYGGGGGGGGLLLWTDMLEEEKKGDYDVLVCYMQLCVIMCFFSGHSYCEP